MRQDDTLEMLDRPLLCPFCDQEMRGDHDVSRCEREELARKLEDAEETIQHAHQHIAAKDNKPETIQASFLLGYAYVKVIHEQALLEGEE